MLPDTTVSHNACRRIAALAKILLFGVITYHTRMRNLSSLLVSRAVVVFLVMPEAPYAGRFF